MRVTAKIFEDEVEPLMRAAIIWATVAKATTDLADKNDPKAKPGLMELHTSAAYVGIAALASIAVSLKKMVTEVERAQVDEEDEETLTITVGPDGLTDEVVESLLHELAARVQSRSGEVNDGKGRQPQ